MHTLPCILFRGGTSKGPFFLKSDLPHDTEQRDQALLRIMGSPHQREIDGIGGGDSLSSKVAIVSRSTRADADIDYLFCQVHVNEAIVETTLNCGNILSGVAPFAIMRGLVETQDPTTTVNVFNENTHEIITVTVQTPNKKICFTGNTSIDGVPGTAAPIQLTFQEPTGAKFGKLLPTDHITDTVEGISITCLDVALPLIIVKSQDLGISGYESKAELDLNTAFLHRLEAIREQAALKMGIRHSVAHAISPKICCVAPPKFGGTIHSCYFTPFACHSAHAVSGACCVAAACLLPGSVAHQVAKLEHDITNEFKCDITVEHVSGKMGITVSGTQHHNNIHFSAISCLRTARPLFIGEVVVGPKPHI